jgi:hypothetical protein
MVRAHEDRLRRYSSDFARMYPKIRLERSGMKMSAQDKCLDRMMVGFDDTQLDKVIKTRFKDGFSAAAALALALQEENDSRPTPTSPPRSRSSASRAKTLPVKDEISKSRGGIADDTSVYVKSESPRDSAAASPDGMMEDDIGDQAVGSPVPSTGSEVDQSESIHSMIYYFER